MLAVTVDIEDWYHVPAVTGSPFARFKTVDDFFANWQGRYDYLTEPTKSVLSLLDDFSSKATFFIVADVIDHYPGLVQEIAARGHEIACHGLHHACKINPKTKEALFTSDEFEKRTLLAKEMLEKASGQEVIGYRAPAAYVGGWMLDSLERMGFKYDSSVSVNSLYNKSDSTLQAVDTKPYFPETGGLKKGKKRGILEIPWPYFDFGVKLPTGGGPLLRFLGAGYIGLGLRQSLRNGDTVFYFHPLDISDEKFPAGFSWQRPFYWIVKGKIIERRIQQILKKVPPGYHTCAEILNIYDQTH